MKLGINAASFPPDIDYKEALRVAAEAGFDGVEPGFAAAGIVSLESTEDDLKRYRDAAEAEGLEIPSVAGGLYWGKPFTSDDPAVRKEAVAVAEKHLMAASILGADTILVVPGVVNAFFIPDCPVVRYDVAWERAFEAMETLAPLAEELEVHVGVENVWNKFLLSPLEMARFVDEVGSDYVGAYFDIGNVVPTGYPEHWIPILGERIRKVHAKDFKADASLESMSGFVDLLQGDVNWPAVVAALSDVGYAGYVTAEMIPGYRHCPLQRIRNTAASLRAILDLGGEGET